MTGNRRIALNVIATYGRSLFTLACGLFTGRWVLMALGEVDYGLMGVVGGLAAFVMFLNGMLAAAVGRFYAYAIGEAKRPGEEDSGLENCRKWFNTALVIHVVVPIILILIGYPLGEWAVRNFLTIPEARVGACVWVWRMACLGCFVVMCSVPWQAMYTAKQNIAELTVYSIASTTFNVVGLYYMVNHPSDWLIGYSVWSMLICVVPQVAMVIHATVVYPECRVVRRYFFLWDYWKQILSFSGVRLLNGLAMLCSKQGLAIVVNKYLGPRRNAAMTVGNSLASHSMTLASSFSGAFWPAVMSAAGSGNLDQMRKLAFRTCKISALAVLVFMIPLVCEAQNVLVVWLKNPPEFAAELCVCVLCAALLEEITGGHWMAVFAIGKITEYQLVASACGFIAVGVGWALVAFGWGIVGVGLALVTDNVLATFVRLYYAQKVAGLSVVYWCRRVFAPIAFASAVGLAVGYAVTSARNPDFLRICLSSAAADTAFAICALFAVLDREERRVLWEKIDGFMAKFKKSGDVS